jgi:hypothetical protein
MSGQDNRRAAARVLTDFPLALMNENGVELDAHAVAHDVSDKGFKAESRAELVDGQVVRFRLGIDATGDVIGRARIVWCQRTDLSFWAGAQFVGLSRKDRRRIRRITSPSDVDWNLIADRAIVALGLTLCTLAAWTAATNKVWRTVMSDLTPQVVACLIAGWALRELLRRR